MHNDRTLNEDWVGHAKMNQGIVVEVTKAYTHGC